MTVSILELYGPIKLDKNASGWNPGGGNGAVSARACVVVRACVKWVESVRVLAGGPAASTQHAKHFREGLGAKILTCSDIRIGLV